MDDLLEIHTPRLRLIACDAAMLEAAMDNRPALAGHPGVVAGPDWPGDELAGVLPLMLVAAKRDPERTGWQAWLVVHDGIVIGDVGPHAPPSRGGFVEIGFSIVPSYRGKGFATEAVIAMCDHLVALGAGVFARADQNNVASDRVLRKAGFMPAGDEGTIVRYERRP